jgi:hypothetical protein
MNQRQLSLFAFSPETAFSDEEKNTLLLNPQAGARMAWRTLQELFAIVIQEHGSVSLKDSLMLIRTTMPDNPKEDMRYWLNYIQHHPGIGMQGYYQLAGDAKYLYDKAAFLLTLVHLVAWGEQENARFMLGKERMQLHAGLQLQTPIR